MKATKRKGTFLVTLIVTMAVTVLGRLNIHAEDVKEGTKAGDRMVLTIKGVEYPFRWCPAGTFTMGSPVSEPGRNRNETQHQVTLTNGFWMLETEVTQEMWESVTGKNPSEFQNSKKMPVHTVSWMDCRRYIDQLDALNVAPVGYKFSLPTEAQWEYACRAGTAMTYHFGSTMSSTNANFGKNVNKTTEVGSYPANTWGLYDMHGNVAEWCSGAPRVYSSDNITNPPDAPWHVSLSEPTELEGGAGPRGVLRGGAYSWDGIEFCRSAARNLCPSYERYSSLGLRLALVRE